MKTKTKQLLLAITMMAGVFFVITAFTKKAEVKKSYYGFVSSAEIDNNYEDDNFVSLYTEVVSFDCDRSDSNVKYQFLEHYHAEEENSKRTVQPNTTYSWVYDSYDEAVESRRKSMAKNSSKRKRTVYGFHVSCK